jgi:hypothetical protein
MTKPAWKTQAMNDALENIFENNRIESIETDVCVHCHKPAVEFTDELSRREFAISGLCQECQDKIFNYDEDEE